MATLPSRNLISSEEKTSTFGYHSACSIPSGFFRIVKAAKIDTPKFSQLELLITVVLIFALLFVYALPQLCLNKELGKSA